ncbi:MAG: sigma-54-dependent transcriptional regulator [Polyangiales bacterium]
MTPRIVIVDDNRDLARGVAMVLGELSDDLDVVHSADEAIQALERKPADLVFSDIRMPGMDGMSLLDLVHERWPRARIVLFTAYGTIEDAVDAMKRGAYDYLTKPFDQDELLVIAQRAWKELSDEDEIARLRAELEQRRCFHGICFRDRHMLPVVETVRRAAPTNATCLIYGESGTGKELVARAVHEESGRGGELVAFNAAALPETLAEAELFGAKKGAYTGADRDRRGLFVEASGGTLFIDEISSMPLSLQNKLLRTLQEREVRPVGGSSAVKVDTRIVAATNVDPQKLVAEGTLRKDLYYRLAVVRIAIPPLRERVEDIPLLADRFLARLQAPDRAKRLSSAALRMLVAHDWPGNVRELQNVIERAAVMTSGDEIGVADILLEEQGAEWSTEPEEEMAYEEAKRRALERFQRRYVERIVAETGGNLAAAARKAGITRAALHRIVKRLGLERDEDPGAVLH